MHVPLDRRAAASFAGRRAWGRGGGGSGVDSRRGAFRRRDGPGQTSRVILGFIGTGGRFAPVDGPRAGGGRIVAISDSYQRRMTETLQQKKADWKTYALRSDDRRREARCRSRGHARPRAGAAVHQSTPARPGPTCMRKSRLRLRSARAAGWSSTRGSTRRSSRSAASNGRCR